MGSVSTLGLPRYSISSLSALITGIPNYVSPMIWGQLVVERQGPSVCTPLGGYNLTNMNNMAGQ